MTTLLVPGIFGTHKEIRAGISTRHGGVSAEPLGMNLSYRVGDREEDVRMNRSRFLAELDLAEDQTAFADQCHSATVRIVDGPGVHPACDGLITQRAELGLAISIADCVPILLFDPGTKTIAAVHAGWRGSAAGIVRDTVEIMADQLGIGSSNVVAYIGPSAGPCCYEVGDEVRVSFREDVKTSSAGKRTIDLKKENRIQLIESGLKPDHIETDDRCTICGPALFHSYRRDGDRSGRMLAVIAKKEA